MQLARGINESRCDFFNDCWLRRMLPRFYTGASQHNLIVYKDFRLLRPSVRQKQLCYLINNTFGALPFSFRRTDYPKSVEWGG
jgi:hypothetical protein